MDKHSGDEKPKDTQACDPGNCASKAEIKNAMLSFSLAYDQESQSQEDKSSKK